jgi:hypothetical protein
MSCGGTLSPVMMVAGAGLLPGASSIAGLGSSLGVSSSLTSALGSFTSLPITNQFSNIVSSATGVLGSGVLENLRTMGADVFPALTNSIPSSFTSALSTIAPSGVFDGGFTGLIGQTASSIMGQGDLTQFGQIFNSAQGFVGQANQFINSNLNVGGISSTFGSLTGGMDNLITGSFSQVTEAFGAFGSDLSKLGNLIDMGNLTNLGNPSALVKQLSTVGGIVPGVETVLKQAGLSSADLVSLASGSFPGISDSTNKLIYEGLKTITGSELLQVKSILGVTVPNISNMAELLDPSKIFPTSFTTLTMPTPDGLRGIYTDAAGTVNTNLEKFLQDPAAPVYTGDDPIIRARLGLDLLGSGGTTLI